MNIENIAALVGMLERLGFKDVCYQLVKRICFKPNNFTIKYKIIKGDNVIDCHLYFEKDETLGSYVFVYYHATMCKNIVLTETEINGINANNLEKQMASINWHEFFFSNVIADFDIANKATWQKEAIIESIINDLTALGNTKDGVAIAATLKIKYWEGLPLLEWNGQHANLKSKEAISQRFYVFNAETDIGLEEACRFLNNSWMEKELQGKRQLPKKSLHLVVDNNSAEMKRGGKKKKLAKP